MVKILLFFLLNTTLSFGMQVVHENGHSSNNSINGFKNSNPIKTPIKTPSEALTPPREESSSPEGLANAVSSSDSRSGSTIKKNEKRDIVYWGVLALSSSSLFCLLIKDFRKIQAAKAKQIQAEKSKIASIA